jgi:hypothetical protein
MPIGQVEKRVHEILNFKEEKQVFRMVKPIDFDTATCNSTIKSLKA